MEKRTIALALSSSDLLGKQFPFSNPGYDPLEVDEYLDRVIRDYRTVEGNALLDRAYLAGREKEIAALRKKVAELEVANSSLSAKVGKMGDLKGPGAPPLKLLKRIDALERALWKMGVNPTKIR